MTGREESPPDEGIRRTTQEERDRAAAVHSVDDETRVHGDPDETEVVQGAAGELRHLDDEDDAPASATDQT
ncbi:hypothetical protein [Jiangella gansuensis]|uniref:hypothetical protein n=1 Tax=Jiangella gansuensis TaxID=281473 RepID=UPI00047A49E7|nr:hypothetical protein [Jiangella gansuensis]